MQPMFDEVLSLSAFEQGATRVVLSQRRRPTGASGLSIEFYGRQPDNRWVETLRLDAFPGETHYHWFHSGGEFGVVELQDSLGGPSISALSFVDARCRGLLSDSGFFPAQFDSHLDPALEYVRAALALVTEQSSPQS
jgi:hypothetical protein